MKKKLTVAVEQKGLEVISIIAALTLWQLVADLIVKNKFRLPSFTDALASFFEVVENGVIFTDIWVSLIHFGIGLSTALVIGIPIGIIMGWFRTANRIIDPLIEIIRPIPPLAWIPFAIVWFGLTHQAAGFLVFLGAVFPIIINTFSGFRGIPRVYVEAARVLGCMRDRDLIRYVALPSALPSIMAGIRIAMGIGWMCLVAAEIFGVSKNGLGHKLWWHYNLHQMDFVLVYMLILGFLGLLIDRVFRHLTDKRLLKWRVGEVI